MCVVSNQYTHAQQATVCYHLGVPSEIQIWSYLPGHTSHKCIACIASQFPARPGKHKRDLEMSDASVKQSSKSEKKRDGEILGM